MDYFVSLHGMCHNLLKVKENDYFTFVPTNMEVYTFTPTNYCIYSNEDSEKMMMHLLKNRNWISSPENNKHGIFSRVHLFKQNNKITNLLLDGDNDKHFGVYELLNNFKKLNMIFDTEKEETTYDVQRLLYTLKLHCPNKPIRIYLCICSPHTISPCTNTIIKWKGKNQPLRNATKKYQSFSITDDILLKSKRIQKERLRLDNQARKRFLKSIPFYENRFTRSMSFNINERNGTIDNIPLQIGVGLFEKNQYHKSLYIKIDKTDEKIVSVLKI